MFETICTFITEPLVVVFIFVKTHMHNTSFSFLSVYQCYFELNTIHPLVHLISCLHNQLKHNHNTFYEISSKFYLFKSFPVRCNRVKQYILFILTSFLYLIVVFNFGYPGFDY